MLSILWSGQIMLSWWPGRSTQCWTLTLTLPGVLYLDMVAEGKPSRSQQLLSFSSHPWLQHTKLRATYRYVRPWCQPSHPSSIETPPSKQDPPTPLRSRGAHTGSTVLPQEDANTGPRSRFGAVRVGISRVSGIWGVVQKATWILKKYIFSLHRLVTPWEEMG